MDTQPAWTSAAAAARTLFGSGLAWPFEALRFQYAGAVRAGLLPNSMRVAHDFDRAIVRLEQMSLGPLARRN
jgi:hypothetical protein